MEIERKFLLRCLPLECCRGVAIKQGYLSIGDPEIRIRDRQGQFFITRKGGQGLVRSEDEEMISEMTFNILWPLTQSHRVIKTRFQINADDGLIWEIDLYHDDLQGLVTAEVELPSQTTEAIMPTCIQQVLIREVTKDHRYKNKLLATLSSIELIIPFNG